MPITLPPISRRQFVLGAAAGAAGLMLQPSLAGDATANPNRFILMGDTHIAGDRSLVSRGVVMHDNLQQAVAETLGLTPRPASVLVAGDLAFTAGAAEDYGVLVELLQPLREAGLPVHLALGNHDNRERFWEAVRPSDDPSPVEDKHVTVLPCPAANWFILDSLDETNKTPGVLGEAQLTWLAKALDDKADKPALLMVHHNPDFSPQPRALTDTGPLMDAIVDRQHVKAVFFGHTHQWKLAEREGIHLVNLPPVAYVFAKGKPSGWVDAQLTSQGATLTLQSLDQQHPQHGETHELSWRA